MTIPRVLRTPDSQFTDLPDYDFQANYMEVHGLRMHYLDEGPTDGPPILLLHGEPSWSYLYRKMIPILAEAGHRVIVPDLIGFGKSDKPTRTKDYTYKKHIDWTSKFFADLNLSDVTLFCQDWGGLIGLRVLALYPDRFARVVAGNTGLPAAGGVKGLIGNRIIQLKVSRIKLPDEDEQFEEITLEKWMAYSQKVEVLRIGQIVQWATVSDLPSNVIRAYDAPFPNNHYKAGARIFPSLIPTQLRENQRVWNDVLSKWKKPFLTAFSDRDPITRGQERMFQKLIPGAKDQKHVTIEDAGHFLQEDKGPQLSNVILDFISSTS